MASMTRGLIVEVGDTWYRFQEQRSMGDFTELILLTYLVDRVTAHGVWLNVSEHMPCGLPMKFVLVGAVRRWALPTEEEALASFIARKRRQIRILTAQRGRAEEAIRLASAWSTTSSGVAAHTHTTG